MKKYICINDQKIALTEEQVAQLKGSFNLPGVKLADVPVGETFKINNLEFVVLGDVCTTLIDAAQRVRTLAVCEKTTEGDADDST